MTWAWMWKWTALWISSSLLWLPWSKKGSKWKGLWFGQLEDGTECSVIDLHCFDVPVIQVVRVRFTRQEESLQSRNAAMAITKTKESQDRYDHVIIDEDKVRMAANYVRRRFPELNREEHPCLYSESRFCRRIVPEEEAEQATATHIHDIQSMRDSNSRSKEDDETVVHQFVQKRLLPKHPGSFSRLGWRIDVFYKTDPEIQTDSVTESQSHNNTTLAWFVFSMSHSIVDGTAMHVVVDDYLQTYMKILQQPEGVHIDLLEPRPQLPLVSSMPRNNLPFTWYHYCWTTLLGLLVGCILPYIPLEPKLVPTVPKNGKTGEEHHNNPNSRSNQYSMACVALNPPTTKALCQGARSIQLTVGSMVHACLFVALANRYFRDHPKSKSLSLPIPLPVNMRKFMIPPLPSTVLAPQQGILSVNFYVTKRQLQEAVSNESMMIELLKEAATSSQNQVQKGLQRKSNINSVAARRFEPLDGPLLAAAMYRSHLSNFLTIKYMGDIALSNLGLYRPSPSITTHENQTIRAKVEATYTFSSPTMANYEFVCCSSTVDGNMTLTMTADPTMDRSDASCHDLLGEVRDLLQLWVDKIK